MDADMDRSAAVDKQILDDPEAAAAYLRSSWFYRTMETIRNARLRNGLTQQDIADKLGTTQSAIARLENAHTGNFSLDRLLKYAWACGAAPLDLEFAAPEELRAYAQEHPRGSRTYTDLLDWKRNGFLRELGQTPRKLRLLTSAESMLASRRQLPPPRVIEPHLEPEEHGSTARPVPPPMRQVNPMPTEPPIATHDSLPFHAPVKGIHFPSTGGMADPYRLAN
jgi:transcriptional regulator with XRE-family HTH domain